ncbi:hypothetical protein L1889_15445 [Paenalcaligenes niemegkensis]|uniref:NfeD family protein n=1 Tax=Paenalcaligenes niemegkensis TaxID=2895469 RepID=UPI001EE8397D|nr:hypothetical protein [Paenalcaligenes niemegkensis]MCQ9617889.1 hypothetical protein [Paenalcaligenes niemegkensis]
MAWIWIVLAMLVLITELLSGTIFLLFISAGLLLPGITLWLKPDFSIAGQLLLFSAGLLLGLVFYIRSKKRMRFRDTESEQSLDIGNVVEILQSGRRASYRGAMWDVELEDSTQELVPGRYQITAIRANTLIVKSVQSTD